MLFIGLWLWVYFIGCTAFSLAIPASSGLAFISNWRYEFIGFFQCYVFQAEPTVGIQLDERNWVNLVTLLIIIAAH